MPNFIIRKFRVPLFLLPIYQAAGIEYGIRWEVLAAINEIETDYGRNLNVSSAGAVGWMQFMPSTWKMYGSDANKDKRKDPYNPVDAIFAAARYLKAAGYEDDVRRAIFAYNHADWYVDSVLLRARLIAGVPADLIGSLTGLTEGRFPVYARARYADDLAEAELLKRVERGENAANVIESADDRRSIDIYARSGSPVVAVNDGVIKKIGESRARPLRDAPGRVRQPLHVRAPRLGRRAVPRAQAGRHRPESRRARARRRTDEPATRSRPRPRRPAASSSRVRRRAGSGQAPRTLSAAADQGAPVRASGHGGRAPGRRLDQISTPRRASRAATRPTATTSRARSGSTRRRSRCAPARGLARDRRNDHRAGRPHRRRTAPHVDFSIRPAGRGAPRIDPKPILDGWKLLEADRDLPRVGRNVLHGDDVDGMSIGQILLLPKPLLERRVLADERIEIYACGRDDIRSGQIDRRVLATLEYLAESGLRTDRHLPQVGPRLLHVVGQRLEHSSGNAVDIAKVNGIPILGHQEAGGITDQAVRRLMLLQGTMQPHQIISLFEIGGRRWRWPTTPTTSTSASSRCSAPTRSSASRRWRCSSPASGPT